MGVRKDVGNVINKNSVKVKIDNRAVEAAFLEQFQLDPESGCFGWCGSCWRNDVEVVVPFQMLGNVLFQPINVLGGEAVAVLIGSRYCQLIRHGEDTWLRDNVVCISHSV